MAFHSRIKGAIRRPVQFVHTMAERTDFTWRFGLNFTSALEYALRRQTLSRPCAQILDQLNQDGVAMSSIEELPGLADAFSELTAAASELEKTRRESIEKVRRLLNSSEMEFSEQKPYVLPLLGQVPKLGAGTIFSRFALLPEICHIADGYLRMRARLRHYNVWHNIATQNAPCQSQLWHRDPEDRYILKVFVYLSKVDEGAGPLTYARGSHQKGSFRREPRYLYKDGATPRSDDSQMAEAVEQERWLTAYGDVGTIVFADTRGYHKGGFARHRDRILFMCELTSAYASPRGVRTART
jgi:hypothetical protein